MRKIAVILGTRPQIIKSAPIIRKIRERNDCEVLVIHTGQHYDYELSKVFFNELELPQPAVNLGIHELSHAGQTAAMMIGLEKAISHLDPDVVVVPGDTNSALAAALTAVKLRIPCAHLEAGPRQFDLFNPEEANRIVVDHLSTIAFAPSPTSLRNLAREGFTKQRAVLTGDTMLDSLIEHFPSSRGVEVSSEIELEPGFVMTTIHRQENTENAARLKGIVKSLTSAKAFTFLFPIHPRTKKNLIRFCLWKRLRAAGNVVLVPPLKYETSLRMLSKARVTLTDSGGIQKEALWLGVPCVTLMKTTPWPETLRSGTNRCVEPNPGPLLAALRQASSVRFDGRRYFSLFGNGRASDMICRSLASMDVKDQDKYWLTAKTHSSYYRT